MIDYSSKRNLAERLRTVQGLSYSEIAAQINVSKSTLSRWLRDVPLSLSQHKRLLEKIEANRVSFPARVCSTNRQRYHQARLRAYQAGYSLIDRLPDHLAVNELALAMLYLGEGSKSGGRVQIANTNPRILRYSLSALRALYAIDETRLSLRLNLVQAACGQEPEFRVWWASQLECSPAQFRQTQFDKRSLATTLTSGYRGVCTITYADTYLQQRLLGLANAYLEKHSDFRQSSENK